MSEAQNLVSYLEYAKAYDALGPDVDYSEFQNLPEVEEREFFAFKTIEEIFEKGKPVRYAYKSANGHLFLKVQRSRLIHALSFEKEWLPQVVALAAYRNVTLTEDQNID